MATNCCLVNIFDVVVAQHSTAAQELSCLSWLAMAVRTGLTHTHTKDQDQEGGWGEEHVD